MLISGWKLEVSKSYGWTVAMEWTKLDLKQLVVSRALLDIELSFRKDMTILETGEKTESVYKLTDHWA